MPQANQHSNSPTRESKKLLIILVLVTAAMFGFAFALVPLYDVLCNLTGLNGKPANEASTTLATAETADQSRTVTVQFLASTSAGMPWEFKPMLSSVKVTPGESRTVEFYVKNRSDHTIIGQAIPSVSPGLAATHLKKIECFCFNQQQLEAGSDAKMPLVFYVDPELPKNINTLTLSYTLYNVTETAELTPASASNQGS